MVRVLGVQNSQLSCKFRADDLYFCLKGRKLLGSTGAFKNCHTSLPHHNTQTHIHLHTHTAPSQNTHILFETFRGAWKDHVKVNYDIIMFYISGSGEGEGPRPPIVLASGPTMGCEDLLFFVACQIISPPPPIEMARGATSNGK